MTLRHPRITAFSGEIIVKDVLVVEPTMTRRVSGKVRQVLSGRCGRIGSRTKKGGNYNGAILCLN